MQLPETDNIHYQHAFKKGYRMALEGKSMTSMPSSIRRDMGMRDFFQQGWEQALEDVANNQKAQNQPNWRYRFTWFMVMVIGGISTALLLINNIEQERKQQAELINGEAEDQTVDTPDATAGQEDTIKHSPANGQTLSLLSAAQRSDLKSAQQQAQQKNIMPLEPLVASPIEVKQALLTTKVVNRQVTDQLTDKVPKYIRQLSFFTQVDAPKSQTIYHRWRYNEEILATIALQVQPGGYRTWSSKKMSSAWLGQWHVEVLDADKNVIYRHSFKYGSQ